MPFAITPDPPVHAAAPVPVSICVADHRIGMQVEIAEGTVSDQSFPRFEAAEERRIRDVDLDVRFIDNHPTRILFVVKISLPLVVAAALQSKVITRKRVVVYDDRLCTCAASLVIPVRQTLVGDLHCDTNLFPSGNRRWAFQKHTDARGARATNSISAEEKDIMRGFLTFVRISPPKGRRAQSPTVLPPRRR